MLVEGNLDDRAGPGPVAELAQQSARACRAGPTAEVLGSRAAADVAEARRPRALLSPETSAPDWPVGPAPLLSTDRGRSPSSSNQPDQPSQRSPVRASNPLGERLPTPAGPPAHRPPPERSPSRALDGFAESGTAVAPTACCPSELPPPPTHDGLLRRQPGSSQVGVRDSKADPADVVMTERLPG